MATASRILVVGSTGVLGGLLVRALSNSGHSVRALVRDTADSTKRAALTALPNVEVVSGDLMDPASLAKACRGTDVVVSTASAIASTQGSSSLQTVDAAGQQALVDAAREQGVSRFVYVSFPHMELGNPLQDAKRSVEQRLKSSGVPHVILQPTYFMETWFSPGLGWDPKQGKARVLGDENSRVNWISVQDVALIAARATELDACLGATIPLSGPEALSQLEVVALFERLGARLQVEQVPREALLGMYNGASNPVERTFAALMATVAGGQTLDTAAQQRFFPDQLRTVRQYAGELLGQA